MEEVRPLRKEEERGGRMGEVKLPSGIVRQLRWRPQRDSDTQVRLRVQNLRITDQDMGIYRDEKEKKRRQKMDSDFGSKDPETDFMGVFRKLKSSRRDDEEDAEEEGEEEGSNMDVYQEDEVEED